MKKSTLTPAQVREYNINLVALRQHFKDIADATIKDMEFNTAYKVISFHRLYANIYNYGQQTPELKRACKGNHEPIGNDEYNDNCLNSHKLRAQDLCQKEINSLETILNIKPTMKTSITTTAKKVTNTVKNFAVDRADNVLNGVHFVAISTANVAENIKCRLHREEDSEDVKNAMMRATCEKQIIIKMVTANAVDRVKKLNPMKAKPGKPVVTVNPTESNDVALLTIANFQTAN